MHFSQPENPGATGDIGDLSAKDGSKETVLALLGMLVRFSLCIQCTLSRKYSVDQR